MTRISFRVFRVVRGYIPGAVAWPDAAAGLEILAGDFESMNLGLPNQITSANAGKRLGFAGKSRVGLSPRPGVAERGVGRFLRASISRQPPKPKR
jgi:hypothetical protein